MPRLFEPIKIGEKTVQARIALAPLTRYRCPEHTPTHLQAEYYGARSRAFPGTLLIYEATFIRPESAGYENAPGIWSQEQVSAWSESTRAVAAHGGIFYCQLWDLGGMANPEVLSAKGFRPRGPSNVKTASTEPLPLTEAEIAQWAEWYAEAARNAIAAGFDGVEIHAANGYLLDQFLHDQANTRTDKYGGSIENRSRFVLEVVDAVASAVGHQRVGIRLSPWGVLGNLDEGISPIPQFGHLLLELESRRRAGAELAYVHLVEPRLNHRVTDSTEGVPRHLNQFARDIWKGVLVRTGALGDRPDVMAALVEADDKLVLGVGRYFISNPDLLPKLQRGEPLQHYDRSTFYWDGKFPIERGYT